MLYAKQSASPAAIYTGALLHTARRNRGHAEMNLPPMCTAWAARRQHARAQAGGGRATYVQEDHGERIEEDDGGDHGEDAQVAAAEVEDERAGLAAHLALEERPVPGEGREKVHTARARVRLAVRGGTRAEIGATHHAYPVIRCVTIMPRVCSVVGEGTAFRGNLAENEYGGLTGGRDRSPGLEGVILRFHLEGTRRQKNAASLDAWRNADDQHRESRDRNDQGRAGADGVRGSSGGQLASRRLGREGHAVG